MKVKFTDFGRCLVCLNNPCNCKEEKSMKQIIIKTPILNGLKRQLIKQRKK